MRAPAVCVHASSLSAAVRIQLLSLAVSGWLGARGQVVLPRCEGDDKLGESQAPSASVRRFSIASRDDSFKLFSQFSQDAQSL